MRKIYIIICIILGLSLLSGCTGELPNIDENHESASEIAINKSETTSSEQTESLKKDGSSNEESSKIEEATEESDSDDTYETEQHEPPLEERDELAEKLSALLEASKEKRIDAVADHIYFYSLLNYRGGEKKLFFEDGKIYQIMIDGNDQHRIIAYVEDSYWFFDDPNSPIPGVIKVLEYLQGRPCYILEDDSGYRLSLFYMNGYFYLMNIADNGQVVHAYSFSVYY